MKKKAIRVVEPREVPEVLAFLDAQEALEEFKQQYPEVFGHLEQLVDRYNTALEQADKVCRQNEVKCGPFDAYQVSVRYNAEALYDAIGRDTFLQVGGSISSKTVYDIDKGRLEAAIAAPNSKVPEAVVSSVRKESLNYHVPTKLAIP
jgi:hypothetical protein